MTVEHPPLNKAFTFPPVRLAEIEVPIGATQCDDAKAIECARIALTYLQHAESGFPKYDMFPNPSLYRAALLGTHTVHYRNFRYAPHLSLKQVIEEKINASGSSIFLLPINGQHSYYCFELEKFSYDILDELKEKTFAIEFMLLLPDRSGGFVFFEDDPACYIFFQSRADFEQGFMSPENAMDIYVEHMAEWRHYASDGVTAWMQRVNRALRANEITPED